MDQQYSALFEPIQIGSVEIKNRFLMCPMEGTTIIGWLKGKGFVKEAQDFYLERARDGIGLMVPGCTPLKSIIGDKWLWKNPRIFEPIKPFMDELPCDTVVVSVGYNSGTPLADAKKHPKNVHIIGDAEHVANLKNAIWSANDLVIRL